MRGIHTTEFGSVRRLVRLVAWLTLVVTAIPPVHLLLPDGACGPGNEADSCGAEASCAAPAPETSGPPVIRALHGHSPLRCLICRELLLIAATDDASSSAPVAAVPSAPAPRADGTRSESVEPPHFLAPRAPPPVSC